jgi:hypothetical protein
MDRFFFRRQESDDTQQAPRVFAVRQIFHNILNWLAALTRFSEEEQQEAGIYLRNQHYK